jgi:hypothetical protein
MDTEAADSVLSKRCAKCTAPISEPDWVVNKVMAYCADCATLLHLGESKESRMFNDPKGGLPVSTLPPEPPAGIADEIQTADEIPLEEDMPESDP